DGRDHGAGAEHDGVVVACTVDDDRFARAGDSLGDVATVLGRHDVVFGAVHDGDRHVEAADVVDDRIVFAQSQADQHRGVVLLAEVTQTGERGSQQAACRRVFSRQFGDSTGAQAFTEVQYALGVDIQATGDVCVCRTGVASQPLLRRRTRVSAVPAV